MIFEHNGKTYTLIPDDEWFLKETRTVEQWIGRSGMGEQGVITRYACLAAVSIARVDPGADITDWLDSQTNKVVLAIYQQIQSQADAEVAAEAAAAVARVASGVVESPSRAGSDSLPGEVVVTSSTSLTPGGLPV